MPGDRYVTLPSHETTLGVTINTTTAAIWPWLMQIGYGRGGFYSYDWLDRLFGYLDAPSAERILPQWQRLAVGDEIPIGRGGGFPVKAIEPFRPAAFLMTRQMLLGIKRRAEAMARPKGERHDPST